MAGIIDGEQISMLVEGAGVDAVRPILEAYWESNDQLIGQLREGLIRKDASAVATTAHGLKGSSANLGAMQVATRAKQIELAAKDEDLDEAERLYGKLPEDIAATRQAFDEVLGEAA